MTSIHQTPIAGPALVKYALDDLPDVTPRPTCVECGREGPDVALSLFCNSLANLCREHRAPAPEQSLAELTEMWTGLAEDLWRGDLGEWEVYAVLVVRRPDLSAPQRWQLFEDLEEAVTLRRDVAEGNVTPREFGCASPADLDAEVNVRLQDAAAALIGDAR